MLDKLQLNKLLDRTKNNIDNAYQHSLGKVSIWFTHANITKKYVITLDSSKGIESGVITQMVLDEPDDQMDVDDLIYLLNGIYDDYRFRLLAHAFDKKTLAYLRERVHAHIREDIVV